MKADLKLGIIKVKAQFENHAYLCLVRLESLFFPKYQRGIVNPHVNRMAASWNDEYANPVKLNIRDYKLNCFNGLQTSTARKRLGHTQTDAIVFVGKTYEWEAGAFYNENQSPKQMAGWVKFHADIAAGNNNKQDILYAIHHYDLTVPYDPGVEKAKDADITDAGPLMYAHRHGGLYMVDRMCMLLDAVWRTGRGKTPVQEAAKKTDFLRGLINFLDDNPELSDRRLIAAIRPYSAESIRSLANMQKSRGRIDAAQFKQVFANMFTTANAKLRQVA